MRSWLFISILLLLGNCSLNAQKIGFIYGRVFSENYFLPEVTNVKPNLFYSYREGVRSELGHVLETHYDYKDASNFQVSLILEDVVKIAFINYVEINYQDVSREIVLAGTLLDENGDLVSLPGYYGFYNYDINYFGFAFGYGFNYLKRSPVYLYSNLTVQGQLLAQSDIYFSHRSPTSTGDPDGLGQDALNRLTNFNFGLQNQNRIGYTFSQKLTLFAGLNLGLWFRPMSQSDSDYLEYLDQYEADYGNLYKIRKGPFPYVAWNAGLAFSLENSKGKKTKKGILKK